MVPEPQTLPDVLPTDRLQTSGMPVPAVRAELRRISNARSAVTVVACLLQTFGVVGAAMWIGQWWAYLFAFVWMGRGHCLLNILGPRGRAPPLVHVALAQRRRREVVARLPDVPGLHGVPAGALRTPQGRDGSRRARPRAVRGLSDPTRLDAPQAHARHVLRVGLEEHGRLVAGSAGAEPRSVVHRRRAGSAVRCVHRCRPVVGVPGDLGRAVDDALEVQQPPPRDRGARGHDPIEGPAAHHARRAADPVGSPPLRAVQHGLAPGAPRRHGRAVAPPPRTTRRARSSRMGHRGAHLPDLSSALAAARLGCARPARRSIAA